MIKNGKLNDPESNSNKIGIKININNNKNKFLSCFFL